MTVRAAFVLMLSLLSPAIGLAVDPLENWQWRVPALQGNDLKSIAAGNGIYVAVGSYETILTSTDGSSWQVHSRENSRELEGVAFGRGQFVAVGHDYSSPPRKVILNSTNGADWNETGGAGIGTLLCVAFGNGRFVAGGYVLDGGALFVSTNGVNWADYSGLTVPAFTSLAFGNGRFVGVTESYMHTSTNGIDWDVIPIEILSKVAFANGTFVAAGVDDDYNNSGRDAPIFATSTDGQNWTQGVVSAFTTYDSVRVNTTAYINGRYVAYGDIDHLHAAWSSTNGVDWQRSFSDNFGDGSADVLTESNRLLGVGEGGTLMTSFDAQAWTPIDAPLIPRLRGVAHGNGRFVAVGFSGAVQTSADGTEWTARRIEPAYDWVDVVFGSNRFVAVSRQGETMTSQDGGAWMMQSVNENLSGAAYGAGKFVIVGGPLYSSYSIFSSTDGVNWTNRIGGQGLDLHAITYGKGVFVAVGSWGKILTSTDTTNWTIHAVSSNAFFRSVAYGNGIFVATGARLAGTLSFPTIYHSADGVTWAATLVSSIEQYYTLDHVAFGGGVFVTGSFRSALNDGGGMIFTSVDGHNWQQRHSPTMQDIAGIAFDGATFIITGGSGATLQSADTRPRLTVQRCCFEDVGLYEWSLEGGVSNTTYVTEYSTNLVNWTPRWTNTLSAGTSSVFTGSTILPARFYRSKVLTQ